MGTLPIASAIVNIAVFLLAIYAWLSLALGKTQTEENLATNGIGSLRYFTVLSNLFSGIVCAVYFVTCGLLCNEASTWLLTLKLVATASVTLTFTTTLAVLTPMYGFKKLYVGANFWMHLILPLLAIIDCCFFVPVSTLPFWYTALGIIPAAIYGAWYLTMLHIHGVEENGIVYDFYGFLRWGSSPLTITIVALVMFATMWINTLLLYWANSMLFTG